MGSLKKKKVPAPSRPRYLHVEIGGVIMKRWVAFRNARKLKRGPLEERALIEYMDAHDSENAKPEVSA